MASTFPCRSVVLLAAALAAGCDHGRANPTPPPAAAEKPRSEADLAQTTLSRDAAEKLGVRSEPARVEEVQDHARWTAFVQARQGSEVILTAPVAGYVRPAANPADAPIAGINVKTGQELFRLEPVLSPVEQIQLAALKRGVEGELTKAKASVAAAQSELERIEGLHSQGLRGQQDVEQARARLQHAREDLAAAEDKLKLFADAAGTDPKLRPVSITSPAAGTVLAVPVSPGQYVPAAAPLATLADLSTLWVRVPVPESDLARIDRQHPAQLPRKAGEGGTIVARLVALVPQVKRACTQTRPCNGKPTRWVRRGPAPASRGRSSRRTSSPPASCDWPVRRRPTASRWPTGRPSRNGSIS
jgi:multidrug efflux pump subunit AcrA (membrane-fusion protein)